MADEIEKELLSDEYKKEKIRKTIIDYQKTNPTSSSIPWEKIAKDLKTQGITTSGRKMREMWINYLDPNLNFGPFTKDEIQTLKALYKEARDQKRFLPNGKVQLPLRNGHIMSWNDILPRRSPNVLKNKYYSVSFFSTADDETTDPRTLAIIDNSPSVERDDDELNIYSDAFSSPGPFEFSIPRFDYTGSQLPGGNAASYSVSVERRNGGKMSRKARLSSRKARLSSRKARKSARKARKSARKVKKSTRK